MLNGEWKCSMTSFRLPYIYTAIGIDAIKYIYIYMFHKSVALSLIRSRLRSLWGPTVRMRNDTGICRILRIRSIGPCRIWGGNPSKTHFPALFSIAFLSLAHLLWRGRLPARKRPHYCSILQVLSVISDFK